MVRIEKEQCIGCGSCEKVCLTKNIVVQGEKANVRGRCMECGHCFAICPVHAIHMTEERPEEIIEFTEDKKQVAAEELLRLIQSRRSIREYQQKPVPKALLEKVLEAGRYTPTAVNAQDVSYVVVQENLETVKEMIWESFQQAVEEMRIQLGAGHFMVEKFQKICQLKTDTFDPLFFEAPVLLLVVSPYMLNGGLAASNIELMASAAGLGALISGFIERAIKRSSAIQEYFGISGEDVRTCLLLGFPAVSYRRTVPRKKTVVTWK